MNIFLSYSGEKSKRVAKALSEFLRKVVQDISVSFPEADIAIGEHWRSSIEHAYSEADLSIVCVTPENVEKPWIHFEVGSLAGKGVQVIPFLCDMEPAELPSPLSAFQSIKVNENGLWNLVQLIQSLQSNQPNLPNDRKESFDRNWPAFMAELELARRVIGSPKNIAQALSGTSVIYFASHGDLGAENFMVPGNHDVIVQGDLLSPPTETPAEPPPHSISAEQAFERINAAVRQNLRQQEENMQQARNESRQFFRLTIIFASGGFLVVLLAVALLLAGQVSAGVVASVASVLSEATAALFFKKDAELRKRIETYHQHSLQSQRLLTMIDVSQTIESQADRDRMKREIILSGLDIVPQEQ